MITVEYCKDGESISDFNYKEWINTLLAQNSFDDISIKVSTSVLISALLLEIILDNISHEDVEFIYDGKILKPNKDGILDDYPDGFADISATLAEKRIIARIKR